jgi:hypothetical protein
LRFANSDADNAYDANANANADANAANVDAFNAFNTAFFQSGQNLDVPCGIQRMGSCRTPFKTFKCSVQSAASGSSK